MRIYRQIETVQEAIAKAGSIAALSRHLTVTETTIRRWLAHEPMRATSVAKLKVYLRS